VWSTRWTVDEFWRQHDRLAMVKYSKFRVWRKVPDGDTLVHVIMNCQKSLDPVLVVYYLVGYTFTQDKT